jgi:hypothetical protein
MARPKTLQGEKYETAKRLIEEGKSRGEICKAVGCSYLQLAREFGNVFKHAANDEVNQPEAA